MLCSPVALFSSINGPHNPLVCEQHSLFSPKTYHPSFRVALQYIREDFLHLLSVLSPSLLGVFCIRLGSRRHNSGASLAWVVLPNNDMPSKHAKSWRSSSQSSNRAGLSSVWVVFPRLATGGMEAAEGGRPSVGAVRVSSQLGASNAFALSHREEIKISPSSNSHCSLIQSFVLH